MTMRRFPGESAAQQARVPPVDIFEHDDTYEVLADLPGSSGDAIDVSFDQGDLTVKARVEPRQESLDHREYGVADWMLGLRFGELVSGDGIRAVYERGVLLVTLPKAASAQRRRIEVLEG